MVAFEKAAVSNLPLSQLDLKSEFGVRRERQFLE